MRLRRGSLDRRLAAGANPGECDDLSRRAGQLQSSDHRRKLATALLTLVEQAEGPTPPISAAVPLDRRSIRAARSDVIALALDLGATELEPSARGIALVQRLLRDGTSPVYAPLGPKALTQALRDAHAALLCGWWTRQQPPTVPPLFAQRAVMAAQSHVKGGIAVMERLPGPNDRIEREPSFMNPVDDGGAGRDMRFAFSGLGLCILAALIVTLLS